MWIRSQDQMNLCKPVHFFIAQSAKGLWNLFGKTAAGENIKLGEFSFMEDAQAELMQIHIRLKEQNEMVYHVTPAEEYE